ncbi:MAG: FAS1-like dehydratase domain-containing protein [Acidimicrobiales bacterium]
MRVERDEVVGRSTGTAVITAERGPVTAFARAVTDTSEVYQRRDAAQAAGFDDIPVPPTYFFSAAEFWGAFPEDQRTDDPTSGANPVTEIIGELMRNGGIILHGEQEFEYHRPIVVGAKLRREGRIADLYAKASGDRMMTFLVTENEYRDESGELVLTSRMNLIHRA